MPTVCSQPRSHTCPLCFMAWEQILVHAWPESQSFVRAWPGSQSFVRAWPGSQLLIFMAQQVSRPVNQGRGSLGTYDAAFRGPNPAYACRNRGLALRSDSNTRPLGHPPFGVPYADPQGRDPQCQLSSATQDRVPQTVANESARTGSHTEDVCFDLRVDVFPCLALSPCFVVCGLVLVCVWGLPHLNCIYS